MTQLVLHNNVPCHELFSLLQRAWQRISCNVILLVKPYAEAMHALKRDQARRKNLRFALSLDSATLRDIGIDKAELREQVEAPFTFSRRTSSHAGLLSVEHNLKLACDDDTMSMLDLMQQKPR